MLAQSRRSARGCSCAGLQQDKPSPAPRISLEPWRAPLEPAGDNLWARKMCGGRKTQGREMRQHWEKSAFFFFFFYYCWGFLFFFFFFFRKVPGKGSDCLEQILMAPGPSFGEITRRSPSAAASPSLVLLGNVPLQPGSCRGTRGLQHRNPPPSEPRKGCMRAVGVSQQVPPALPPHGCCPQGGSGPCPHLSHVRLGLFEG